MLQDQPALLFLLCDDEEKYREGIPDLLADEFEKFVSPVGYQIHVFEDGTGPLYFLQERGDAAGVILISDYDMPKMDGGALFWQLSYMNLLPAHSFLCSSMEPNMFQNRVLKEMGIRQAEDKIALLSKGDLGEDFSRHLPAAIQSAGKEIGLDFALRPEEQARLKKSYGKEHG